MLIFLSLIFVSLSFTVNEKTAICDIASTYWFMDAKWTCGNYLQACSWSMIVCSDNKIVGFKFVEYTNTITNNVYSSYKYPGPVSVFNIPTITSFVAKNGYHPNALYLVGNLTKLTKLVLSPSAVSISIPQSLFLLHNLIYLDLSHGRLYGTIPTTISISSLTHLNLNDNKLNGELPSLPQSLLHLDLGWNTFNNSLPLTMNHFPVRLTYVDISNNQFVGALPMGLTNLTYLSTFVAYNNYFSGYLPKIGNNPKLVSLARNKYGYPAYSPEYKRVVSGISPFWKSPLITTTLDVSGNWYGITNYYGEPYDTSQIYTPQFSGVGILVYEPQDVDDCMTNKYTCPLNSYCSDGFYPPLSYTCSCNSGYQMITISQATNMSTWTQGFSGSNVVFINKCVDIDECSNGQWTQKCYSKDSCINYDGEYKCCPRGYTSRLSETLVQPTNGSSECVDINECKNKMLNNCTSNSICVNTIGSYYCCAEGYTVDLINENQCVDVNECNNKMLNNCTSNSMCVNTIGSYYCCSEGYTVEPTNRSECVDLNECSSRILNNCTSNSMCVNIPGSYYCCAEGYTNGGDSETLVQPTNGSSECVDIDECSDTLLNNCVSRDMCVNIPGSYYCCLNNTYNYNDTCVSCFSEYIPVVPMLSPSFLSINSLSQSVSLSKHLKFSSCIGTCSSGISIQTRNLLSSSCSGETVIQLPCRYPCKNLTEMDSSSSAIHTLYNGFTNDGFLEDVFDKFFNKTINTTLSKKRGNTSIIISLLDSSVSINNNIISSFLYNLSTEIVPNSPNLDVNYNNNTFVISSTDNIIPVAQSKVYTSFIVIPFFVLCLLFLLIIASNNLLRQLPDGVAWSYSLCSTNAVWGWEYRGDSKTGYYYKNYKPESSEYNKLLNVTNLQPILDGCKISSIDIVYNRRLLSNFVNQYLIQKERYSTSKYTFFRETWDKSLNKDQHQNVISDYNNLCTKYEWNEESPIKILPVCHGTELSISEKICETGFASLSSLDAGWYGKGIYFSTYPIYCKSYYITRRNPSIILSWILPGNTYPVIEDKKDTNNLIGKALKNGYTSHYVVTDSIGNIFGSTRTISNNSIMVDPNIKDNVVKYNEFVIGQEAQIVPIAILHIEVDV